MMRRLKFFMLIALSLVTFASCNNDNVIVHENEVPDDFLLPRVDIYTENGDSILSKVDYVNAKFIITDSRGQNQITAKGKIRGRGNSTWDIYPKKPYKIKFDEKQTPFGWSSNKDWVLLPDFIDMSLLRTAYMSEVSKVVGLDFTINYQHADVYLNGEYIGIYMLTDQVEKAKNRVNVTDDGFLIEEDNAWRDEPLYFVTDTYGYHITFKYPNADKGKIVEGDANFMYISSFFNEMETALLLLDKDNNDQTYLKYIDIESFAKWYLVAEILAIEDPNRFYSLYDRTSKLKMGPMWDAEWSLGLWANPWPMQAPESIVESEVWVRSVGSLRYIDQLLKSPFFLEKLREEWKVVKPKLADVHLSIKKLRNNLRPYQSRNFERWPEPSSFLNVLNESWEEEVDFIIVFFDRRVEWLDKYIYAL